MSPTLENKTQTRYRKYTPWHIIEKQIQEEINWLRNSIATFGNKEKQHFPITCRECLMRRIAVLIVTGKVNATQINKKPPLKSFWNTRKSVKGKKRPKIHHGSDWHSETMKHIENHFLSRGYQVEREPNLLWGRADLGVYKKGKTDLIVEVGTTSFFKLWINLARTHNFIYLMVPNNDTLIEFVVRP